MMLLFALATSVVVNGGHVKETENSICKHHRGRQLKLENDAKNFAVVEISRAKVCQRKNPIFCGEKVISPFHKHNDFTR